MFGEYAACWFGVQGTTKKPLLLGKHERRVGRCGSRDRARQGPVSLQRPRLLLRVSWEARESCGQRTDMNRRTTLKYHTVENKLWQQEAEFQVIHLWGKGGEGILFLKLETDFLLRGKSLFRKIKPWGQRPLWTQTKVPRTEWFHMIDLEKQRALGDVGDGGSCVGSLWREEGSPRQEDRRFRNEASCGGRKRDS